MRFFSEAVISRKIGMDQQGKESIPSGLVIDHVDDSGLSTCITRRNEEAKKARWPQKAQRAQK
jgi:hypothetical protein